MIAKGDCIYNQLIESYKHDFYEFDDYIPIDMISRCSTNFNLQRLVIFPFNPIGMISNCRTHLSPIGMISRFESGFSPISMVSSTELI